MTQHKTTPASEASSRRSPAFKGGAPAASISDGQIGGIVRRIGRPIVLIGLMGAGKSTVGRRLAAMMQVGFIDADDEIQAAAQMSIGEMFDTYGERYFRDGERRVMARLMDRESGVIATGGGAFCEAETRALILKKGLAVWIDCSIDVLVQRTARRNSRPLLQQGDPRTILADLHERRAPLYAQAPIRISSDDTPHNETAIRILEAIERWL